MVPNYFPLAHPLGRLRNGMDRLFERVFDEVPEMQGWFSPASFPATNMWEDDKSLYAEFELPGVKLEDIEVTVVGNELTLKGQRRADAEEGASYHRRERGVGSFSRVMRLPQEIDAEKVSATMKNGILLITFPKSAAARARKVEVKALRS